MSLMLLITFVKNMTSVVTLPSGARAPLTLLHLPGGMEILIVFIEVSSIILGPRFSYCPNRTSMSGDLSALPPEASVRRGPWGSPGQ